jgi:hypothetical protein
MSSSGPELARTSDSIFAAKIIDLWDRSQESWGAGLNWHEAVPGDVITPTDVYWEEDLAPHLSEWESGIPEKWQTAIVVLNSELMLRLRHPESGEEIDLPGDGLYWDVIESQAVDGLRAWALSNRRPEGVAWSDSAVGGRLWSSLKQGVDRLCDDEPVDYHPGSGTRVRDLVHPSLYPYVEGRSVSRRAAPKANVPDFDRFGRPFERSRFQWLPTPFTVSSSGSVSIDAYINNLDRARHPDLYGALSQLFEAALPLFESVLGYVDETDLWIEGADEDTSAIDWTKYLEAADPNRYLTSLLRDQSRPVSGRSLRNRTLQVIPKIVEYRLTPGEEHEGVWHVEGMSHEHVIATCVYVLERDETILGGDLEFRRAFTSAEAEILVHGLGQISMPTALQSLFDAEGPPLGGLETPEGRMIVFPNSHIHRLSQMRLAPGADEGRRRIVVFWLVDPDVQIHSTADVEPQQEVFTREEALEFRLELMEERRLHKQSLNPRAVNLCEH